jgi:predicted small secreted protein
MKSNHRIMLRLLAAACLLAGFTGCRSTVHGVGHDVERAGRNINNAMQ